MSSRSKPRLARSGAGRESLDVSLFLPVVAILLLLTGTLPGTADAVVTPMVQFGPFLYLVVLHRLGGQTLGKSLTGLRVVRTHSEAPISWRQSMVRAAVETGVPVGAVAVALLIEAEANVAAVGVAALVFSIVVSNLWAAVDCGAALFDSEQRTLHDRAAGTRVARVGA